MLSLQKDKIVADRISIMKRNLDNSKKHISNKCNYEPKDIDVIISKGTSAVNHQGNKYFKRIVQLNLQKYASFSARKDKTNMIRSILHQIRSNGGNFVKQDSDSGMWSEVDDIAAREKISQAFRNSIYRSCKRSTGSSSFVSARKNILQGGDDNKSCPIYSSGAKISLTSSSRIKEDFLYGYKNKYQKRFFVKTNDYLTNTSVSLIDDLFTYLPTSTIGIEDPFEPIPIF